MNRRRFLATAATGFLLARTLRLHAAEVPRDVRITRIVGFDVISERSKIAGKNARLDVHGDKATDGMARLYTNKGIDGVGNCRIDQKTAASLIGKDPFSFYREEARQFAGPFGVGTMPFWDLFGRLTQKPVWQLLGGAGPERVPVYDGSIYFADLLPRYAPNWRDRLREEIDMGLAIGHRAFKIKVGRGNKWMPREEGDARDVEVIRTIRRHAGPEVLLGIDANNGYDRAGAQVLLERVADTKLAFVEEMFDETVDDCLAFKEFLLKQGNGTLLADGETQGDLNAFKPFIEARAIDVLQADMNRFGFEGILTEAAWAREKELRVAPHNWGSLVGYYMQLHVGRAIPNFYRAEHDPLSTAVLIEEGYERKNGETTVPDTPGFGLTIDEQAFASAARIRFDAK